MEGCEHGWCCHVCTAFTVVASDSQGSARLAEDEPGGMQQSPSASEGLLSADEMLSTDDYFGRRRSVSASGLSAHSNDHSAPTKRRVALRGPSACAETCREGPPKTAHAEHLHHHDNHIVSHAHVLFDFSSACLPSHAGSGRSRGALGARAGGPGSGSAGSKSSTPAAEPAAERLAGLMARAADLLLVLSHADSTVKVPSRSASVCCLTAADLLLDYLPF